jgi:predicted nuclease of predicted toxin-antitoxin system
MRFLVDAQLPPILARFLEEQGLEARAVREVGLRDASDKVIWDFAAHGGWIIVTKDEDFPERVLRSRAGPQVVWLRIGNSTKRELLAWFASLLADILRELAAGRRIVEARQ